MNENTSQPLKINGSMLEGGGSILRLSAGFSILFNQPIKIYNIRANRSKPGLRLQHLLGLKTLAKLTNSKLSKCEVGTKELTFKPSLKQLRNKIDVNINTAASIGLLLQPIQIACLRFSQPIEILIHLDGGGTIGKWAPGLNYLKNVAYRFFENAGYKIDINIHKYGFYPKGGGITDCRIYPPQKTLKPIRLTELGNVDLIQGKIVCTKNLSQANVSERINSSAQSIIKGESNIRTNINIEYVNALSTGVGVCLWATSSTGATISSGTIVGERHISSEEVGKMAADKILNYIKNDVPIDNYLSDQILPLIAYIEQSSIFKVLELTSHSKTNLELIKLFTDKNYKVSKKANYSIIEVF